MAVAVTPMPAELAGLNRDQLYEELVRSQTDKAVGLAYHLIGGDREAAKDIAQDAFIRAYEALPGFRGDSRLSTWFYRILVNQAFKYRRRRSVRQTWQRIWQEEKDRAPSIARAPEGTPVAGDPALRNRIGEAMEQLSSNQRVAFSLVHLEGMTINEAAEVMRKAPGTVKSHLHRALLLLRRELSGLWQEAKA